ncbi:MAG TPA: cytochrome-c peroxidase [Anaeromyxobacteraceae bacterium]|nr:cytochrome-c peroxidase [Anaeromyxobacteraceae bacterium]
MTRIPTILALTFALAALPAVAAEDLMKSAQGSFKPLPAKAGALKGNPPSPAKVTLGAALFFDPRLSSSQLISCNTCHNVGLGGADLQETSIGHGWQKGPRNAPTVLNAVFNVAQFWDGRAEDLKAQAKGPVQASVEMANEPARLVATLRSIPGYGPMFEKAFPGVKEAITFDNVAAAIEVFEATLLTPNAPFDRFLKGDARALKAAEKEGLGLFLGKGCVACHAGVNVGGDGYFAFGVVAKPGDEVRPPGDTGRFKVTHAAADEYAFRSPSLRNVAVTQPYFHSGKVWRLEEAVKIMGTAQLGAALTDAEAGKIVAFLGALTGDPPRLSFPVLPPGTDATPRPETRVQAAP